MANFSDSEVEKDLRAITKEIIASFDPSELRDLAWNSYVPYNELTGETLSDKARELVLFVNRRGWLDELMKLLREKRPGSPWPDIPSSEEPQDVSGCGSGSADHAIDRVHKYSGTWKIQNSFSLWRGVVIEQPDSVSFTGTAVLIIPFSGEGGSGIQVGRLTINVESYHAIYDIVNEVQSASVDQSGTLKMHVKVIQRHLVKEDPTKEEDKGRYDKYRKELEHSDFKLILDPDSDEPDELLRGGHIYRESLKDHQLAKEEYQHLGVFYPPSL